MNPDKRSHRPRQDHFEDELRFRDHNPRQDVPPVPDAHVEVRAAKPASAPRPRAQQTPEELRFRDKSPRHEVPVASDRDVEIQAAPPKPAARARPEAAEVRFEEARKHKAPWIPATADVEVRKDQRPSDDDSSPPELAFSGKLEVFRDAGEGKVPVEAHLTARSKKRVRVMTTGVFDLLHLGHIQMLEAARKLGDELVVVIARDETVRKQKHEPVNPEDIRRRIVAALKPVTEAILGHTGDIYRIVPEIQPDVIALGYDQPFDDAEVVRRCKEKGVDARVVRLPQFDHDLDGTRKIIQRIGDRIARKEFYQRGGEPG